MSMQVVMFTPCGESIKISILLSLETLMSTKNSSLFSSRDSTIVFSSSVDFMLLCAFVQLFCYS